MRGRKPKVEVIEFPTKRGKCPSAPGWMTPHAKAEWKRAAPELHGRSLLSADTLATLESYCIAVGMVREMEDTMMREGRIVETDKGPKRHPAFSIQAGAMREARLLAAELGLTPHRRGLKGKSEGNNADGWDPELLA